MLGLFPFHPFPMDEYFNQQHDKKNVKTVHVRVRSEKVSNQAPSLKSFSPWFAAMIGKQARMETWMLINRTRWTTGSIHQPICIVLSPRGHVKNHHWLLLALETFMTDMLPNCGILSTVNDMFEAKR